MEYNIKLDGEYSISGISSSRNATVNLINSTLVSMETDVYTGDRITSENGMLFHVSGDLNVLNSVVLTKVKVDDTTGSAGAIHLGYSFFADTYVVTGDANREVENGIYDLNRLYGTKGVRFAAGITDDIFMRDVDNNILFKDNGLLIDVTKLFNIDVWDGNGGKTTFRGQKSIWQ